MKCAKWVTKRDKIGGFQTSVQRAEEFPADIVNSVFCSIENLIFTEHVNH